MGSEVQDPRDVRVAQRGQHLGRAPEADRVVLARLRVAQDLDGDLAVELVVVGGVDDAHAALANGSNNLEDPADQITYGQFSHCLASIAPDLIGATS